VVVHAHAYSDTVVTHEVAGPSTKQIKIPSARIAHTGTIQPDPHRPTPPAAICTTTTANPTHAPTGQPHALHTVHHTT
jgi:hypothetical protein